MNFVARDRSFAEPVRYVLESAGNALFVLEGAVLGVTAPGNVVRGENVDQDVVVEGRIVGARGTAAIAMAAPDASVRVAASGVVTGRDYGGSGTGFGVDFRRGGEFVNAGTVVFGVEMSAGLDGARIVNTGTIGAQGDGFAINVNPTGRAPAPNATVEIVNDGAVRGTTRVQFDGPTTLTNLGAMEGAVVEPAAAGGGTVVVRNRPDARMEITAEGLRVDIVNQGLLGRAVMEGEALRLVNMAQSGNVFAVASGTTRIVNGDAMGFVSVSGREPGEGELRLVNTGTAGRIFALELEEARIVNRGTLDAVRSRMEGDVLIDNAGTILGPVVTRDGNDTVRNTGTIGEPVAMGPGDDRFEGRDGGAVEVDGGGGADIVSGSAGDDRLTGGAGADVLMGRAGDDVIDAGGAFDDALLNPVGTLDIVAGGAGDDAIQADGIASGGSGNDTIVGAGRLEGRDGNDAITVVRTREGNRTDTIDAFAFGGTGNDTLQAGSTDRDDPAFGLDATGAVLDGGAGDDVLDAVLSQGVVMRGGEGADTFTVRGREADFVLASSYGEADVADFEDGIDRLDMAGLDPDALDIAAEGADVVIRYTASGEGSDASVTFVLATLRDTDLDEIDRGDFVF